MQVKTHYEPVMSVLCPFVHMPVLFNEPIWTKSKKWNENKLKNVKNKIKKLKKICKNYKIKNSMQLQNYNIFHLTIFFCKIFPPNWKNLKEWILWPEETAVSIIFQNTPFHALLHVPLFLSLKAHEFDSRLHLLIFFLPAYFYWCIYYMLIRKNAKCSPQKRMVHISPLTCAVINFQIQEIHRYTTLIQKIH